MFLKVPKNNKNLFGGSWILSLSPSHRYHLIYLLLLPIQSRKDFDHHEKHSVPSSTSSFHLFEKSPLGLINVCNKNWDPIEYPCISFRFSSFFSSWSHPSNHPSESRCPVVPHFVNKPINQVQNFPSFFRKSDQLLKLLNICPWTPGILDTPSMLPPLFLTCQSCVQS